MCAVGSNGIAQDGRSAGRNGLRADTELQTLVHILESDRNRGFAHVGDLHFSALLLALEDVAGFELGASQAEGAEMDRIQLGDRQRFLMDDAPQVQDDGLLDVRDIGGQGLVEGVGAVFVLESGGNVAFPARGNAFLRPLDVGAAAGGDDVEDGDRLVRDVRDRVAAADGPLCGLDVPEIVDGAVQLHAAAETGLCLKGAAAEGERGCQYGFFHPFHHRHKGNDIFSFCFIKREMYICTVFDNTDTNTNFLIRTWHTKSIRRPASLVELARVNARPAPSLKAMCTPSIPTSASIAALAPTLAPPVPSAASRR